MKKRIIFPVFVILIIIMVGINLFTTREKEVLFQGASLSIEQREHQEEALVLTAEQIGKMQWETIRATYQRKVGPAEEKNYQGIALPEILKEAGIIEENVATVAIVARDQYRIELSAKEAFEAEQAYLVMYEDEEPLSDEEGDYMLVLRKDQLSTRWVKQVVSLEWQPLSDSYEQ